MITVLTWLLVWILLSIPVGIITGHLIETPDDDELL
jgi:hypothetical protein